jgi:hypothetical protein
MTLFAAEGGNMSREGNMIGLDRVKVPSYGLSFG